MDTDRRFVVDAVAGSVEAFEHLVRRYHVRMYTLARILTNGGDEVEDLVQETFLRAFRAIGDFRGDCSFQTWLYRIATNVIRSHLGRERQRISVAMPVHSRDDDAPALERIAAPEDLEATLALRDALDRALATLPDELQLLITLRDVVGLDYQEIATATGLPKGTVASRVFYARRRLRPLLEPLARRPVP